jgi:hypothetical protein
MRRLGELRACCASRESECPTRRPFGRSPLPAFAGRDKANYINAWMPVWARPRIRA